MQKVKDSTKFQCERKENIINVSNQTFSKATHSFLNNKDLGDFYRAIKLTTLYKE